MSTLVAKWSFEQNLLDSQGGNHLTYVENIGPIAYDDTNRVEGDYALSIANRVDFVTRADADLDAGFPLKSGDTTKTGTWLIFYRPGSISGEYVRYIISKYLAESGRRSFALAHYQADLRLYWGYNNGGSFEIISTGFNLSASTWYFIAVTFDGVGKSLSVEVYDCNSLKRLHSSQHSPSNEMWVGDAPFSISNIGNGSDSGSSGQYDACLVHDGVLSSSEIESAFYSLINKGGNARVTQQYVEAAVAAPSVGRATQLYVEVACLESVQTFARVTQQYVEAACVDMITGRVFPVPHLQQVTASHPGKRVFPLPGK
jgi:hypothetical protein